MAMYPSMMAYEYTISRGSDNEADVELGRLYRWPELPYVFPDGQKSWLLLTAHRGHLHFLAIIVVWLCSNDLTMVPKFKGLLTKSQASVLRACQSSIFEDAVPCHRRGNRMRV